MMRLVSSVISYLASLSSATYLPRNSPHLLCNECFSLSLFLTCVFAPLCANGPSQPLSYQSFPHSFPCHAGGAINLLLPRVNSHEALVATLQICPSVFNNFHDAPPATPFLSYFCSVARAG